MSLNQSFISDFSEYYRWSQRTKIKYKLHYGWCTGRCFTAATWPVNVGVHIVNKWVHGDLWQLKAKVMHWHLSKVTQIQNFKLLFLKKILACLKPNSTWSLHGILVWKCVQMIRVTWPRWPPGSYMVKTFKYQRLRNQDADNIETSYTASATQVLPSLFKWCHWVDRDHFYVMFKFIS